MTITPDFTPTPEQAELALPPILWKELLLNPVASSIKAFVLINKINELEEDIKEYQKDPDYYAVEIEGAESQLELQKSILDRYPQGIRKIYSLGENLKRYPAIFFHPARFIYVAGSIASLGIVYAFKAFMYFNIYILRDFALHYILDLYSGDLFNDSLVEREESLFPEARAKYLKEIRLSDVNFIEIDDEDELIRAMQIRDNSEGWVTSEDYEFDEVDEKVRRNLIPQGKDYLRLVSNAIRPMLTQPLPTEKYAKALAITLMPFKFLGGILLMGFAIFFEGVQQLTNIAVLGLSFLAAATTAAVLSFVNLPLFLWDAPEFFQNKYHAYREAKAAKKTLGYDHHDSTYRRLLTSDMSFTGLGDHKVPTPVPAVTTPLQPSFSFLKAPRTREKPAAAQPKRVTLVV